jgi:hypothetical protein
MAFDTAWLFEEGSRLTSGCRNINVLLGEIKLQPPRVDARAM